MLKSQMRIWLVGLLAVTTCASLLANGSLTSVDSKDSEESPTAQPADMKQLLAGSLLAATDSTGGVENLKVRPGDVKWHSDFDSACKAAEKSGRPVMLFQMMGKLDERFT